MYSTAQAGIARALGAGR